MTTDKTVLVVDDDASTCELIREMLEGHYRVVLAHDGVEAFEWTRRGHIDLILMDIRMPLFSGYWFCDAFKHKKTTKNIPIVLFSGMLDEEGTEKAMKAGACATMKKPFDTNELLEVVSKNAL